MNENQEDEIVEQIISKINERLYSESNNREFTATESQVVDALNKSLEEIWPTIRNQEKRKILEKSFGDINFKGHCSKCKCKCKCCSKQKDQASDYEASDSSLAISLL